ncbi:transcription termination factor family protein [Senna tora]|uniref:Transcription termination factor family protein n=1 Tax=Senna tora TaxID=362788 RepID=A0A834T4J4_9FABA|nr:transcription termination factor family protein [Senna tora]
MSYRFHKSALYLNPFMRTSPIPWLCVLLPRHYWSTIASKRHSFRLNYLINNCGFSPKSASELSKQVSFINSDKPDAVLNLFRNLNISDSKIRDLIRKAPCVLSRNPTKSISLTLEFLRSKGASDSQIVHIITSNPWSLHKTLDKCIIPRYDLIRSFVQSDEKTLVSIKRYPRILDNSNLPHLVRVMLDTGVPDSGINLVLRSWPEVFNFHVDEFKSKVDEVKALGFDPSKTYFLEALRTKLILGKTGWERKVELYGRWGWSDEMIFKAFSKRPFCMLTSDSKIEAVMDFFVNHMGWDSSALVEYPILLGYSLKKRIVPRASVLLFLQSKGLIKKKVCYGPFLRTEELFLQKFVNCFKDEAPLLLTLRAAAATRNPERESFTVNYLVGSCGFSPEDASAIWHRIPLKSSENPDSVIALFKSCDFSESQIRDIIRKAPGLLMSDPVQTIWPKLDFLLSKGLSCSDLVKLVTKSPLFLLRSLDNHIIPSYDFVKEFVGSDEKTITSIKRGNNIISGSALKTNIKIMLDIGVPKSGIVGLLNSWPALLTVDLGRFKPAIEKVKELGVDPSKAAFIPALYTTIMLRKSNWNSKVQLYKKWGWSDEEINKAFLSHPNCMLKSASKITAVMEFFVENLGWDSHVLATNPIFISLSLEKRLIPRAFVLQYLHSRGLIKNPRIVYPYYISENLFLEKFVIRFEKEHESPGLMKLYEEKMNISR